MPRIAAVVAQYPYTCITDNANRKTSSETSETNRKPAPRLMKLDARDMDEPTKTQKLSQHDAIGTTKHR